MIRDQCELFHLKRVRASVSQSGVTNGGNCKRFAAADRVMLWASLQTRELRGEIAAHCPLDAPRINGLSANEYDTNGAGLSRSGPIAAQCSVTVSNASLHAFAQGALIYSEER